MRYNAVGGFMSSFFAMVSRMKYINRWGLMKNTRNESLSEHSLEVAMIAHALAIISIRRFDEYLNADRIALLAMYHDASEILTGDLPTPIKYYNEEIKTAYKQIEDQASSNLYGMIPEDLAPDYSFIKDGIDKNSMDYKIIKAADKISALIKCIEEDKAGNTEFKKAQKAQLKAIKEIELPCVKVFMDEFIPSFKLSLDELDK